MTTSRRDFLRASATFAVASVADGVVPAAARALPRTDVEWVKSVCRFCGTGCGVMLGIRDRRLVALRGDPEHPTTKGLVCAKSLFLPKIVAAENRLRTPMIRKDGTLQPASWDEAMSRVADEFARAIEQSGPNSVAYYGSGQALSEESYFANRLFKGGIGTNNVEGNPRLCMASAVGGYVSTFGKDEPMGCYDDIEHAKVFFLVGSNTAECHPVIFDQILARKQAHRDVLVVVCDPRRSPVMSIADIHLDPIPGYDLAVYHAMAQVIVSEKRHDAEFIERHCQFKIVEGGAPKNVDFSTYARWLDENFTPARAEQISGVPAERIVQAARLFAIGPTLSFWTMGLNQRTTGVWANNLIHNLHLITGQIGKPGATPFSLTGQPNACGGVRDTGSLCHILPYGRSVTNAQHRGEMEALWGAAEGKIPSQPGLNTIEMFRALARDEIRAMLVLTTNPGQSLPNLHAYRDAMGKPRAKKPFLCVIDAYPTRTTELADVVLPAAMWTEKSGVFGMSERRYQYQPHVCDAPGEARPDLEVLFDLAQRLEARGVVKRGFSAKLRTVDDVWDEMRQASKDTAYDFTGMTRERLQRERGLRWPCPTESHPGTARRYVKGEDPCLDRGPYADSSLMDGELKFYGAPEHRAIVWLRPADGPAEPVDDQYPMVLSTGRVLEHWHTGTMTMEAPELRRAYPECYVEIHPDDARRLGVRTGQPVRIVSRRGEAVIKARVVAMPRPGMVFVPWHWADEASLINYVTIDAYDPGSKQPEFKVCACRLEKL
ncbi:MAG: nitrate reductase [Planctomycetes bacterium]|nr:nitrate reductase [Planctomycetota bacterium]